MADSATVRQARWRAKKRRAEAERMDELRARAEVALRRAEVAVEMTTEWTDEARATFEAAMLRSQRTLLEADYLASMQAGRQIGVYDSARFRAQLRLDLAQNIGDLALGDPT